MISQSSRAGVCIIRLEYDGARILVSLRIRADIVDRAGERQHRFLDTEQALEVVRDFMTSFVQGLSPRPGIPGPGGDTPDT